MQQVNRSVQFKDVFDSLVKVKDLEEFRSYRDCEVKYVGIKI